MIQEKAIEIHLHNPQINDKYTRMTMGDMITLPQNGEVFQRERQRYNNSQEEQRTPVGGCFNCGGAHFKKDCPRLRKNSIQYTIQSMQRSLNNNRQANNDIIPQRRRKPIEDHKLTLKRLDSFLKVPWDSPLGTQAASLWTSGSAPVPYGCKVPRGVYPWN